jgi:molybdate transport system substrate-binding protein
MRTTIALVALLVLSGCQGKSPPPSPAPPQAREVKVAAASDLKFALDDIASEFKTKQPAIDVKVTYGSSGNFFAQLSNKAPFDIYLSADIDYPRKLMEAGLASKDSEFQYAVGQIVVWAANESQLDLEKGMEAIVDPSVRKIAIANPRHAPYGRAAEAAMKQLGVYDAAKDRLVLGENIAQTAQFVETGAADVGIIALSLAMAPAMKDKGRYWTVPLDAYPRLEQGGIILNWATDADAAKELRAFIVGPEGKAVLKRYGFFMPGE